MQSRSSTARARARIGRADRPIARARPRAPRGRIAYICIARCVRTPARAPYSPWSSLSHFLSGRSRHSMPLSGSDRRRKLLCSFVYYWWYFALGATISSLGSLLPGIGRQTGATLEQQKWLVPPRATGFGVGSIIGGWLLERADGHRIMAAAAAATTIVNMVMAFASSFELVVVMQLCYGLLGGGSEVVINTLTLQCAHAPPAPAFSAARRQIYLSLCDLCCLSRVQCHNYVPCHMTCSIISAPGRYRSATMVLRCRGVVPLWMLDNPWRHSPRRKSRGQAPPTASAPRKQRATTALPPSLPPSPLSLAHQFCDTGAQGMGR